jgi:hypothetical protein
MPTLIFERGFRVIIYYNDHEPAHVHVKKAGLEAKIQLEPVQTMDNYGFSDSEIKIALELWTSEKEVK